MGGLGRQFDGGCESFKPCSLNTLDIENTHADAKYCCPPASQVQALKTTLPWEVVGAMPEMLQTAWGSLFRSLRLVAGDRLLIRGGTTAVGLAAAAIAKNHGVYVAATSRSASRAQLLRDNGADLVLIDDGSIAEEAQSVGGFDKVLELVGTTTLVDSLRCASPGGVVCMTGIVGDSWSLNDFAPFDSIPTAVYLTTE